jgi:hypothetical protein
VRKQCQGCRLKDAELARLREVQGDQIKAHVIDAERKQESELARWAERFDRLLRLWTKEKGL